MCAMDQLGMSYGAQAISLAQDIGVFDLSAQGKDKKTHQAYSFTAWCLFHWSSIKCFQMCIPSLLTDAPKAPLPDPEKSPAWYGETWIQYPSNQTLYSLNHGNFFRAKCQLSIIINSLARDLIHARGPITTRSMMREAISKHVKGLKHWYSSLPDCLSPTQIVFPFQLHLHLTYHNAMIGLCAIPISQENEDVSIENVGNVQLELAHSRICFETIMRQYYLRHGFETADAQLAHNLVILAYKGLSHLKPLTGDDKMPDRILTSREEARSTLILAAKGLSDQGKNYFFALALFQIIRSEMTDDDLDVLHRFVTLNNDDLDSHMLRTKHIRAQYPVDIIKMTENHDVRRLSNLIERYSDMRLDSSERSLSSEQPGGSV